VAVLYLSLIVLWANKSTEDTHQCCMLASKMWLLLQPFGLMFFTLAYPALTPA